MENYSIYHLSHDDVDGKMPTILSKLAFGESVYTQNVSNKNVNKVVKEFLSKNKDLKTSIYITDISVNDEVAELLENRVKQGQEIILFDHHKTAIEQAQKYEWMNVIVERNGAKMSATTLYYEYLQEKGFIKSSNLLNELTELVRLYDTWDWSRNNIIKAKQLNDLYYLIGEKKFEEVTLEKLKNTSDDGIFKFTTFEQDILKMEQEKIDRYIHMKGHQLVFKPFKKMGLDYTMGLVYGENYHSELGNELCKKHPEMDFIVIVDVGNRKISFRSSKSNVDTSIIAKHYGGGGHAQASGCGFTVDTYNIFIKEVLESELKPIGGSEFECINKQNKDVKESLKKTEQLREKFNEIKRGV